MRNWIQIQLQAVQMVVAMYQQDGWSPQNLYLSHPEHNPFRSSTELCFLIENSLLCS
jgi:hypothetical protein